MITYEYDAIIQKHEMLDAAYVEFPHDVQQEFGTKGQVKVVALFDGIEYRGSLARMGHHCHVLGMTKEIRRAIGKNPGDTVHVVLRKDDEPRAVELPLALAAALANEPEAMAFFESLSYTHKKEYAVWIADAKRPETMERRVRQAVDLLKGRQHKG